MVIGRWIVWRHNSWVVEVGIGLLSDFLLNLMVSGFKIRNQLKQPHQIHLKEKPEQLEFTFRFKEEQLDLVIGAPTEQDDQHQFYQRFEDLLASNRASAKPESKDNGAAPQVITTGSKD